MELVKNQADYVLTPGIPAFISIVPRYIVAWSLKSNLLRSYHCKCKLKD
jgi:hypothetical protein